MKKYKPMLAKLGKKEDLERDGYIFEPKIDGYRALCYFKNNKLEFFSRNLHNITKQFPELDFESQIHAKNCILDGEIIVYDYKGVPRFELMQGRSHITDKHLIEERSEDRPATYVVFDILMKDGKELIKKPLLERKDILDETVSEGNGIEISPFTYDGKKLWKEVKKGKLEGVIAKTENGHYLPGKRGNTWIKVKLHDNADCVIIGFTQEKRHISSLALGMYDKNGNLHYVGSVGTGFSESFIDNFYKKLSKIIVKKSPIARRNIIWVRPKYVAEIKYVEWTRNKRLRAPVFIQLRDDKDPEECIL